MVSARTRAAENRPQPMDRIGKVEETGRALYLASHDGTFCTGQNFIVDGGVTI